MQEVTNASLITMTNYNTPQPSEFLVNKN